MLREHLRGRTPWRRRMSPLEIAFAAIDAYDELRKRDELDDRLARYCAAEQAATEASVRDWLS